MFVFTKTHPQFFLEKGLPQQGQSNTYKTNIHIFQESVALQTTIDIPTKKKGG